MRILITGATGLLGSHLVEKLTQDGHHLTALVGEIPNRSFLGQNISHLKNQVELLEGRLETCNPQGTFDIVIHNAAKVSANSEDQEAVWSTNLAATQSLYEKLSGRFEKWVQVSSIATICDGSRPSVSEQNFGEARNTAYAQSKLAADRWLEQKQENLLTIHPCYMLGRWDSRPSSGALFFALRFGKIKSYANVVKNFVAARDVANGISLALNTKAKGHYILGNENIELKSFFNMLCSELGVTSNLTIAPLGPESTDLENEFCLTSAVDWTKAKKELNYHPKVSVPEMLHETMNYFEQFKMLKRQK